MLKRLFTTIKSSKKVFKNDKIPHKLVQLITEAGQNEGNIRIEDALAKVNKKTHDLILVNESGQIPVCKIVSKKLQFDLAKKVVKKAPQLKELVLNTSIAEGDFKTKMSMATNFLQKGNNIQFTLKRNGEIKPSELLDKIMNALINLGTVNGQPKPIGKLLTFTVKPNKK